MISPLGPLSADGADVVDYPTEIPLPGRSFAPSTPTVGAAECATEVALPAFVAGPENRLVAATIERLLDAASDTSTAFQNGALCYMPRLLALFGATGTGKTHLARGLAYHWQQQRGAESAEYVTASDFRRLFAAAIDAHTVADFRRHFRGRQLLAIDDLQRLPNDDYLMQEFRSTLDECEENGGTVVVTSGRFPGALPNLPPDLCSRLVSGLVLQLAAPGTDARARIVRHASSALGRTLSDEATRRLAAAVTGTAGDLFSALFELLAAPAAKSIDDVSRAEQLLTARAARRPTLREIVAVVARYVGLPQKQLKSSSRKQSVVLARGIVVYLARELASASYDQIGRALGGRDHTTIMHNYHKIDRDRQCNFTTQETLDDLCRILLSR